MSKFVFVVRSDLVVAHLVWKVPLLWRLVRNAMSWIVILVREVAIAIRSLANKVKRVKIWFILQGIALTVSSFLRNNSPAITNINLGALHGLLIRASS